MEMANKKIIKSIRRRVNNFLARNSGHGSCPNCGDNWRWKPHGSIQFKTTKALKVVTIPTLGYKELGMVNLPTGIMICKECLSNPNGLNPARIKNDLIKSGWSFEDATLAKKAIVKYRVLKLSSPLFFLAHNHL